MANTDGGEEGRHVRQVGEPEGGEKGQHVGQVREPAGDEPPGGQVGEQFGLGAAWHEAEHRRYGISFPRARDGS